MPISSPHADVALRHLEPSRKAGGLFMQRGLEGIVTMLNLLRFREVADYTDHPELAPVSPISGAQAFDRYIRHTLPYLRESGGDVLFLGSGGPFLIGPESERWDKAMLVRQKSVSSFLAFASHGPYLAGLGHRMAALEDSRLLPLVEETLPVATGDPLPGRSLRRPPLS
ncbi:DUF1330 domain-containing protein [Labrys monachus]|uniref:DUF1330 domain-containing protein n=1 Tax=Labrys monachus TaxID=217067 RepID=A0ABU0FFP3_9HYPH|nr:DUF1330 domain-containing protein [Labrys monachus]MDQ0393425.1 hypothetical protein [Labrys monachus]